MAIQTTWMEKNRVILQRVSAESTTEDFMDGMSELNRFARQSNLHLVMDFSDLVAVPSDMNFIAESIVNNLRRSRIDCFITVGESDIAMNIVAAMMPHFYNLRHRHVHSQEEAFDFLSMMNFSIPSY